MTTVLKLEVSEGGTARRATVRAAISMLAVARVQPGCELAVRVDPAGPSTMVIDPAPAALG